MVLHTLVHLSKKSYPSNTSPKLNFLGFRSYPAYYHPVRGNLCHLLPSVRWCSAGRWGEGRGRSPGCLITVDFLATPRGIRVANSHRVAPQCTTRAKHDFPHSHPAIPAGCLVHACGPSWRRRSCHSKALHTASQSARPFLCSFLACAGSHPPANRCHPLPNYLHDSPALYKSRVKNVPKAC